MVIRGGAIAAIAWVSMAALPTAANADGGPSFNGNCDFGGVEALFDPPLSPQTAQVDLDMAGNGECTGLLNGTPVLNKRTTLEAHFSGPGNCLGTPGMTGPAVFRFGATGSGQTEIPVDAFFRLDPPAFTKIRFTGGSGVAAGTGIALGTYGAELKPLLEYDFGCVTGAVCDAVTLECKTQRRGALEFEIDTNGTTLTPKRGPAPAAAAPPPAPKLTTLLELPAARRCGRDERLRFRVADRWRSKVASLRVSERGRSTTRSARRAISIRGPRAGRSILVGLTVRLADGRVRTGQRRFVACR